MWFPTHAEFDTFASGGKYRQTPVFHESYDIVRGSLALNRDLPDSRFSLDWKGSRGDTDGPSKARRDFQATPAKPLPQPLPSDPLSVQKYQEDKLAEADRQAKQLDASPPGQGIVSWANLLQWGSALLGVAALCVVLIMNAEDDYRERQGFAWSRHRLCASRAHRRPGRGCWGERKTIGVSSVFNEKQN